MVIKSQYAVVASIAVSGPRWAENVACLTELHFEHCCAKRVELPIEDPLIFILMVIA